MRLPAPRRSGFSLTELLVVIAIIVILLALIIPVGRKVREQAQLLSCANNMKQITSGLLGYTNNNDGYLPLAGNVDRNNKGDWVWGGQSRAQLDARAFTDSTFGFLPECGAAFTEITGLPRVVPTGGADAAVDKTREYKMYRCPSTGELGKYLRNNYSMNDAYDFIEDLNSNPNITDYRNWGAARARAQISDKGVRLSKVRNPAHKIILVNESPKTMLNASFAPGGTAARTDAGELHVSHDGRTNAGMVDGHISQYKGTFFIEIQKSDRLNYNDRDPAIMGGTDSGQVNNLTYWWGPVD